MQYYYWATPLFWLADYFLQSPVRVAAIDSAAFRNLYYLGCIGCGIICWLKPGSAALVGIAETSVNYFLLIAGIYLPIVQAPAAILDNQPLSLHLSLPCIINFCINGFILFVVFNKQLLELRR